MELIGKSKADIKKLLREMVNAEIAEQEKRISSRISNLEAELKEFKSHYPPISTGKIRKQRKKKTDLEREYTDMILNKRKLE